MYEEIGYFGNWCILCTPVWYVTVNETRNTDMPKVSITLNYHLYEVVSSEFLDFEDHKYEIIDFFSWCCALEPQQYIFSWNKL